MRRSYQHLQQVRADVTLAFILAKATQHLRDQRGHVVQRADFRIKQVIPTCKLPKLHVVWHVCSVVLCQPGAALAQVFTNWVEHHLQKGPCGFKFEVGTDDRCMHECAASRAVPISSGFGHRSSEEVFQPIVDPFVTHLRQPFKSIGCGLWGYVMDIHSGLQNDLG